jgi:hypothetical protein
MLTDIPQAQTYSLFPLINNKRKVKIVPVGGLLMMNYTASLLNDDDIEGVTGIADRVCILFVKKTTSQCDTIVKKATEMFDAGALALINSEEIT